ncbi:MAG: iron ABC transporter permease [Marinovum algicola]|jgi:iron(III) transport system permease protein|uniref:Iron(III) transport system permease protein n=1 Tax=Marinovum algicola TaxID=42444 RepID=A0A975W6Q0_9RHOB|nr:MULTISPECIES: iron ABC transporter permease [Marinovum]MDD9740021.1 iron ABC transporter permease [Marinovum sp. SP66]SEI63155.1 iron(III) transport system permease protein [Marinovum algicola]SLN25226.1 Putative 2-aminoethylphosphonate transport system permease protein PhnU [Marinovum algicola]
MPTDSTLSPPRRRRHAEPLRLLRAAAYAVAGLCLLPILAVTLAGVTGGVETLTHLAQTVLPRYAGNTLVLVACVALGTLSIGTGAACFVTMTEFRGRRLFEILLVVPLAFPAYVLAYAYTHLLDHPGIVQSTLREVMGWGPRDYWFPEIRSLGGAAAMLVLVLYPYVYLLARAAFLGQSASTFHAARALGNTPLQAFLKVTLPMARPAIAAGVLLATMETIADFGTVSYFGVPTFATGIYTSWFSMADRAAAAQLSLGLLAFALTLAVLERRSRGEAKYHTGQRVERLTRLRLHGSSEFAAWALCAVPVLFGAVIPIVALVIMGQGSGQDLMSRRYLGFIQNSLVLAGTAALCTLAAAVVLGFFHRAARRPGARWAIYAGRLGYAVPGGVIAVGLMVPFAAFDNALDAVMRDWFGVSTGLLFTGSIWVLVFAYMIRFMAAAIGAYEGGQSAINPNLDAASRVLGQSSYGTLRRIHLPILTPSLLTALLIVFVDVMKELPATLILRPFNYDTLAVQAHRLAADERLEGAAVPSLVIVAVGVLPVILLCRRVGRE